MSLLKDIYSFFGKDSAAIWRKFAREHHGTYAPASDERVLISHKGFTIAFDAYTHYSIVGHRSNDSHYTRAIVEFPFTDNFRLLLTKQDFIDNIGRFFGSQDIQIGDSPFDRKFMVKSNDEHKTIAFLADPSIRASLQELPIIRFTITDQEGLWGEQPKKGHCMLYAVMDGKATRIEELNALYRLFADALDTLVRQYRMTTVR